MLQNVSKPLPHLLMVVLMILHVTLEGINATYLLLEESLTRKIYKEHENGSSLITCDIIETKPE